MPQIHIMDSKTKAELNRICMINLSSLKADINHYTYMRDDGRGDKGYWQRQIDKAEAEMEKIRRKMEGL